MSTVKYRYRYYQQYLTDISSIFPISVPFFLVLPSVCLLIPAISVLSLNC
ncbi:hypothetical protein Hanom_Chr09g00855641 [Helianthus anomalus]